MENILEIIYDRTIKNKILNLKDIVKILEILGIDKCLNDYILNINVRVRDRPLVIEEERLNFDDKEREENDR